MLPNCLAWLFLAWVSPSSYWMSHCCELCFDSFFVSAPSLYAQWLQEDQVYTKQAELLYAYTRIRENDTCMYCSPPPHNSRQIKNSVTLNTAAQSSRHPKRCCRFVSRSRPRCCFRPKWCPCPYHCPPVWRHLVPRHCSHCSHDEQPVDSGVGLALADFCCALVSQATLCNRWLQIGWQ